MLILLADSRNRGYLKTHARWAENSVNLDRVFSSTHYKEKHEQETGDCPRQDSQLRLYLSYYWICTRNGANRKGRWLVRIYESLRNEFEFFLERWRNRIYFFWHSPLKWVLLFLIIVAIVAFFVLQGIAMDSQLQAVLGQDSGINMATLEASH